MMFLAFSGLLSGDLSIRCSSYVVPPSGTTNSNDLFNGVTMYVDGNTATTATMSSYHIISGTMSTSGTTAVTISSTAWSSARMFIGNAAEVVMYSGPLTTAQRQNVESYLANKWGLVSALPAGHPNATTPAGLPLSVPYAMRLIFALSKFMSQVFTLSTYSLAGIANTVSLSTGTPAYVWVASVPPGAKGKNGILAVVFNLYNSAGFASSMSFDYGVYVDGVSQFMGDSTTMRYVQTASGNYAIAYGGISLGTNGIMGGLPLFFPLVLGPSASQIQIGLANSSMTMTGVAAASPSVGSNVLTSSGTLNTGNYVPQNTFTTVGLGSYTVPTTVQGGTVTGVFIYCWGASGQSLGGVTWPVPGSAGFVSGYYSCSGGTILSYVVGSCDGLKNSSTGGSASGTIGSGGNSSGGFSGVFLSNAGGIVQSNALIIAGGSGSVRGGSGNTFVSGAGGAGAADSNAYGIGYSGGAAWLGTSNVPASWAGSLNAAGINTNSSGGPLYGGGSTATDAGGGGGYYGGAGGNVGNSAGSGGSSFAINSMTNTSFLPGVQATSWQATLAVGGSTNIFFPSGGLYGYGGGNNGGKTGLIVIVPAVGTAATQIGVSATLFSA